MCHAIYSQLPLNLLSTSKFLEPWYTSGTRTPVLKQAPSLLTTAAADPLFKVRLMLSMLMLSLSMSRLYMLAKAEIHDYLIARLGR